MTVYRKQISKTGADKTSALCFFMDIYEVFTMQEISKQGCNCKTVCYKTRVSIKKLKKFFKKVLTNGNFVI